MGEYENDGSVAVNLAKVILLLINMGFLVGGGLLVYFSQRVRSSGWLDAFQGDYSWIGTTTLLFILILGCVVIILSGLGCFGAWFRNRIMLTVYAVVLMITAVAFIVVAVGANSVKSKAKSWDKATYPAVPAEASIADNFNKLYCYSPVVYYCTEATAVEVTKSFKMNIPAQVTALLGSYTVTALCSAATPPAQLADLCQVCKLVDRYKNYVPVKQWADESCRRTTENQIWCGTFLLTSNSSNVFSNGSPYSKCRKSFLDLVVKWSNFLFACALIVTITTIAVFGFSCLVRQGTNRPYKDNSFVVDSP